MVDPLVRAVFNLMARFGGDAMLQVTTGEGTYDPSTSTTTSTIVEYPIRVIAQDYIQKTNGMVAKDGTLIQTGDKQFFIRIDDGIPMPRPEVDFIVFGEVRWTVKTAKDYNPSGGKSYLYEVYARL